MIRRWLARLIAGDGDSYWYLGEPISRAEYLHLGGTDD